MAGVIGEREGMIHAGSTLFDLKTAVGSDFRLEVCRRKGGIEFVHQILQGHGCIKGYCEAFNLSGRTIRINGLTVRTIHPYRKASRGIDPVMKNQSGR